MAKDVRTHGRPPSPPGSAAEPEPAHKDDRTPAQERAAIAARAAEIRAAILNHPDETRSATAGEVAAALALIERLARAL